MYDKDLFDHLPHAGSYWRPLRVPAVPTGALEAKVSDLQRHFFNFHSAHWDLEHLLALQVLLELGTPESQSTIHLELLRSKACMYKSAYALWLWSQHCSLSYFASENTFAGKLLYNVVILYGKHWAIFSNDFKPNQELPQTTTRGSIRTYGAVKEAPLKFMSQALGHCP